jgi:short subunit dehydrogenase-like uncharacterized protein
MKNRVLIYGAYGYTGDLIARVAKEKGLNPILSGRDAAKLQPLADNLGLEARPISLDNTTKLREALADVAVVIHAAGPFIFTATPMADACIATGTHYLDITGEIEVFEAMAAKDAEAQAKGIMLMPGTGFDVVPSDCLAKHLSEKLPNCTHLKLAFYSGGKPSRGTAKTIIEGLGKGGAIRKDGKIIKVPAGYKTKEIDFGDGKKRWAATIPWGDVSTAWYSTGIPNIEVYMAMHGKQAKKLKYVNWLGWLLNMEPVKNYLKAQVDKRPAGPDADERELVAMLLVGEATNKEGIKAAALMKVPEGYTLTAMTSVAIAQKVLAGEFKPGFQTPSNVYGSGFIGTFPGATLRDL